MPIASTATRNGLFVDEVYDFGPVGAGSDVSFFIDDIDDVAPTGILGPRRRGTAAGQERGAAVQAGVAVLEDVTAGRADFHPKRRKKPRGWEDAVAAAAKPLVLEPLTDEEFDDSELLNLTDEELGIAPAPEPDHRKIHRRKVSGEVTHDVKLRRVAFAPNNVDPVKAERAEARAAKRRAKYAAQLAKDEEAEAASQERRARKRQLRAQRRQERKAYRERTRQLRGGYGNKLLMLAAAMVILAAAILYPAARTYYITVRNNERLAIELTAVEARNEAIAAQVDTLRSDEGIEDMARSQLGWVRRGEEAVAVQGAVPDDLMALPETVETSTITAPSTPMTRALDVLFFTDTDRPVQVNSQSGDILGNSASNPAAQS